MVRRDEARKNVERGKVHPQMYDFMRDARKVFTPDTDVVYEDPRAPNTVGRSFKQWGNGAAEAEVRGGAAWPRTPGPAGKATATGGA